MIVIQVHQIKIAYGNPQSKMGERVIIKDFDLAISAGECVAVIGANGAGKSSLLRVISGLQDPDSGSIDWNGKALTQIPLRDRPKFLSNMFSQYQRMAGTTVRDMVSFGRQPYTGIFGKLKPTDWEIVDEALGHVSMQSYADKMVESLSDGEFRKVMLAKMWAQDAPIMVLDEPTSHLDMPSALEFVKLMRNTAHTHNKAIVFSSHNLPLAFKFADKILAVSDDGSTVFGAPSEVLASDQIQTLLTENGIEVAADDFTFKFSTT